jgi:hypothetical protein
MYFTVIRPKRNVRPRVVVQADARDNSDPEESSTPALSDQPTKRSKQVNEAEHRATAATTNARGERGQPLPRLVSDSPD